MSKGIRESRVTYVNSLCSVNKEDFFIISLGLTLPARSKLLIISWVQKEVHFLAEVSPHPSMRMKVYMKKEQESWVKQFRVLEWFLHHPHQPLKTLGVSSPTRHCQPIKHNCWLEKLWKLSWFAWDSTKVESQTTITSCNNLTGKCTCTNFDWVVLKVEIERPVHASLAST